MRKDYTSFGPRRSECGTSTSDVDVRVVAVGRSPLASDPITERTRAVWSAGDYDPISAGFRHEARAFVKRLALTPAQQVLDAACGSRYGRALLH